MEDIKFGTISKDMREKAEKESHEDPSVDVQKSKKITLKDIDFSDRNSLLGAGEKVAKPCSFGAREGLAERAKDMNGLYYSIAESLGEPVGENKALILDQNYSKALGIKIMNTPLDELDEEIAENLINEIRSPYDTIFDARFYLAKEEHYIEINNNTKLDINKHPLYAKLQEAIDELNRRGVVFNVSNGRMIENNKKVAEILGTKNSIKI